MRRALRWLRLFIGLLVLFTGSTQAQITVSYINPPKMLPVETTAVDILAQVQAVKDNLFFLDSHFRAGKVGVQFDAFRIPNGEYARLKSSWTEVLATDGTNLLRAPTEQDHTLIASDQTRIYIFTNESKAKPASARGTVLLQVPYKFAHITFTPADVNSTRTAGSLTATLQRCEGRVAQLFLTGDLDKEKRVIVFRDTAGRQLERERYEGDHNDKGVKYTYTMRGTIAQIEIMMAVEYADITLDVHAVPEPAVVPDQPLPATTRYVAPGIPTEPVAFTRATLLQQCSVTARREDSRAGYDNPQLAVTLPPVANSAYATVDFGKPRLLDAAGNDIEYQLQRYESGGTKFTNAIDFIIQAKKNAMEFTRAVGSVTIHYPVVMKVVTLTPAAPRVDAFTVQFTPPLVKVNGLDHAMLTRNLFSYPELGLVRAFDATGRQLKALAYRGSQSRNNIHWQVYAFWGTPAEIRIYTVTQWLTVELPYDLSLAELLPASK